MRWLVLVGGVVLLLWHGAAVAATPTPANTPTPRDTETPDASARGAARTPVELTVPVLVPAELQPDAPVPH